ncbi:Hypothetical protein CINCED_3A018050 [Cinara cedri]|nr:Hypothetical protein CINCED_3A018050 [Cinara cedri]
MSITYTYLQDIEILPPYFSSEHELLSALYSAQETDLEDNKTNIPEHFFENAKSILQRLPDIAKEIADAFVSDIATNVTPTWGVLNNRITNLKEEIPNVNVSCSFKRGVTFYTINIKFNSILFGTQNYKFNAEGERTSYVILSNIDDDKSNDESDNKSDEEHYITIPISSLGENVISITTEEEFIKRASDTHSFPYHVVIAVSIDEQEKWCQGVLIKSNWILTSRTCIKMHFDIRSSTPVKVFLDAINHTNSEGIFYSNVVFKNRTIVGMFLLGPVPDGLDDLLLSELITTPETTKVSAVALKLPEHDILEEVNCFVVTRCSDGVVRGLLYKLTGQEFKLDFEVIFLTRSFL